MADVADELQAIRDFVNQSATSATFSYSQLNVNYQDDELRGNGEGEEEEEEEDEDPPAPSSAFQDAPALAASSSKPRVTLRLSGGSSSSSSSAAQTQSFTSQFEFGKELSQIETGNLSSMLEEIGYLHGEDGNHWDFGAGGQQVESSKVSWGDDSSGRYKAMSTRAKMEWFDKHGDKLINEPDDQTFRRLFGSGKGRTPDWRSDFTKWCVFCASAFNHFIQTLLPLL
jgi:hypothetical protein